MVVFLANRANLQSKRLHDRIQNRLSSAFDTVRRRRAEPRESGPYRVVAEMNPRQFLGDDEYPVTTARIEIGFQLQTGEPHEYYWFNWIEPARRLLVGWHQDETHDALGPVHLQVNDGDVVAQRLTSLPTVVTAVTWEQGRPVGVDPDPSLSVGE